MNNFIYLNSLCIAVLLIAFTSLGFAAPNNDHLAAATTIDTLPFTHQTDTEGASSNESSELSPQCLQFVGASVWYQYTATSDQTVVFDTFAANYDTALSIWSGTQHPLTQLACNDDHSNMPQSQVSLELETGTTYYINISGYKNNTGNLVLNARQVNSLSNDDLADAIEITLDANLSYQYTQTTQSATLQSNEKNASCAKKGANKSVWYQYTPPSDQTMALNTVGSDYNTVLSVWTGNKHPLTEIACNDDNSGPLSQVGVNLENGKTYYINVAAGETSPGSLSENTGLLVLNMILPPSNDEVANAIFLEEPLPYNNTQTTGGASVENDEPSPSCSPDAGASVWYLLMPTTDYNNVTFSLTDSSYDAVLSLWQGTDYPVTELGCNDNAILLDQSAESQVTIPLIQNEPVYIDISGVDGETGFVTLQVTEGETDFSIGSQPQSQTIEVCETANLVIGLKNKDGDDLEITDDPVGSQWEMGVTLPFVYQWYQDEFGNVTTPTPVAEIENNPVFITPPLEETTDFWVHITNPTGSLESEIITVTVEEQLDNNGAGVDANGNSVSTDAHFMGAITTLEDNESVASFNQSEAVSINFTVKIDSAHIEQLADILMVGVYTPVDGTTSLYMREGDIWIFWPGDIASLTAAEEEIQLSGCKAVSIFEGRLAGLPGSFKIHTGYRLSDGEIIFNGESVDFIVEP